MKGLDKFKNVKDALKADRAEKDLAMVDANDMVVDNDGNVYTAIEFGILEWDYPESVEIFSKYDKNLKKKFGSRNDWGVIVVKDEKGKISVEEYQGDKGFVVYESEEFEGDELNEKLITFGGKAYPKFGNAVLLAGGAGSGKGFVKDNLMGIEGQVYDVDEVKQLALKSDKIKKMAMDETGKDISKFNLKNPDDVGTLHTILDETLNVIDKRKLARYAGILIAPADRKPNLIFDVTLKNLNKLRSISSDIEKLGYEKINTHLVWVINDYNVAKQQNKERSRQVPEEILMDTHRGAAQTAKDILDMGKSIDKYLDGDIWYAFNKRGVDSTIAKSDKGGSYIKDANYIKVKEAGKGIDKKKVTDEVVKKIAGYVPPSNYWG